MLFVAKYFHPLLLCGFLSSFPPFIDWKISQVVGMFIVANFNIGTYIFYSVIIDFSNNSCKIINTLLRESLFVFKHT